MRKARRMATPRGLVLLILLATTAVSHACHNAVTQVCYTRNCSPQNWLGRSCGTAPTDTVLAQGGNCCDPVKQILGSGTGGAMCGDTCFCAPGYQGPDQLLGEGLSDAEKTASINIQKNQTGWNSNCFQCDVGKYKDTKGSALCTNCPAGTYIATEGGKAVTECTKCPANSNSPAGSTDQTACTANAGFKASAGGTFVSETCPKNAIYTTTCTCNAGYAFKFGTECQACVPGKYKDTVGNVTCTDCPAGKVNPTTASTAFADCKRVPTCATISSVFAAPTISAGGSGYTSAPTVVFSPPPLGGSVATGIATVTNGVVTSVTMTSPGSGYTSAPTISFTGGGGTGASANAPQFSCNAGCGYVRADGHHTMDDDCVACAYGKQKNQAGNSDCIPTGATVSSVCGVSISAGGSGYTSAPTVLFFGGGGSAASGTATVSNGVVTSVTMTSAGSGYTSAPTISFTGGGGTGASANAASFCCNAGYGFVRADGHYVDDCVACVPGKYKNEVWNSGCANCPANTYSPTTALTSVKDCKTCGNFRVSPSGSFEETACICAAGYGSKGGTNDCSACQPGTYKDTEGNSNCMNCWSGSYGETLAATTVDSCKTCGRGSYSVSGSIKESDCVCDSDFRHLNNGSTWTCAMHLTILIMVVVSFFLILVTCCIVSYRLRSPSPPIKDAYQPVPQPVPTQRVYRTVWSQTPPERLATPIPMSPPEYSVSVKPRVEFVDTVEMVTRDPTPQPVRMMPVHPVQYEQSPVFRQLGAVYGDISYGERGARTYPSLGTEAIKNEVWRG